MKSLLKILIFSVLVCILQAQADNPIIAVMNLDGNGVSKTDLGGLSNRLRSELFKTGRFTVIERGQMDQIMKEQEFQMSGCTSQECVVEVGQMLGVKYIVVGSVDKVGKLYSADIRMVNVESGKIENSATDDCDRCRLADVMKVTLKNAAKKLAGLQVQAGPIQSGAGVQMSQYVSDGSGGKGDVYVSSSPSGGKIYLNDVHQTDKMTPAVIENIPVGKYIIKIIHQNGISGKQEVTVQKDGLIKINIPLKAGSGKFKIFSEPPGADVFVDKKRRGQTPILLTLDGGKHVLSVKKDGFIPCEGNFTTIADKTSKYNCQLKQGMTVVIKAQDKSNMAELNAKVFLNSKDYGKTPITRTLPIKKYELKVSLTDYEDVNRTIEPHQSGRKVISFVYG